jgi:hypothetical protein
MAGSHSSGRPISWLVVFIAIAGFVLGGLGLIGVFGPGSGFLGTGAGPAWWLFGVGVVVTLVAGVLGQVFHVMEDVS